MMSAATKTASPLDRALLVTFFPDWKARAKSEARVSLRGLAPKISATTADSKTALPWLKLARFGTARTDKGSLRHNANVLGLSGVEGDYDHELITVDAAAAIVRAAGVAAMIYTSPSHTEDAPRWRILCPLSRDHEPAERDALLARVNGLFQGALSRESFALSQSYYFGSVRRSPSHRVELVDGDFLDLRADLDDAAIGRPVDAPAPRQTAAVNTDASPYCRAVLRNATDKLRRAGDGTKHHTLRDTARLLGGYAHAAGWTREAVVGELIAALPPSAKDLKAARTTAEWGFDQGAARPINPPPPRSNVVQFPAEPPPDYPDDPGYDAAFDEPAPEDIIPPSAAPRKPIGDSPFFLPLVWFDDIAPTLDAADFVQGVLVAQSGAVVYGESNAGKTFWTTDLALHVAAGIPWNGRRVEQGGVVYCVLEGGRGFVNRVAAWRDARGAHGIPFAAIPASLNLLDPAADVEPLIADIKTAAERIGHPIKLVVVDTLSRALAGGNENDSEDMGMLVRNMDRIRQETGACVLFIHHSGKDQARGARGHSLLRAAVDTEIEVVAGDGEEKTASVVKQRELSKGDMFGFKLDVVELGQNRHGEAVTTCLVTPVTPTVTASKGKVRLSDSAGVGVRALHIALSKSGALLPPVAEYPSDTVAVTVTAWRDEFYQLKSGSADNNRQAFSRAEKELLVKSVITIRNGLVWLVKEFTRDRP